MFDLKNSTFKFQQKADCDVSKGIIQFAHKFAGCCEFLIPNDSNFLF